MTSDGRKQADELAQAAAAAQQCEATAALEPERQGSTSVSDIVLVKDLFRRR